MTIEEAMKAELSKGIHAQLTDLINKAVRKGYDMAKAELIHCKDCKYWWKENALCAHPKSCDGNVCCVECDADFYCAWAERKEHD